MVQSTFGLATEQIGPDSANRHPTTAQSDWPDGIVEIPRLESRVYSIWVNGNENFYFKATPEEINQIISLFSKAIMRDHELTISTGTKQVKSFKGDSFDYNVNLRILSGIALSMTQEEGIPDTFEPKLTIYTDNYQILAKQLKLPDNIILNSDIEDFPLKGKSIKPDRNIWYGQVQIGDLPDAPIMESGLTIKITLWQKDKDKGIQIDRIDYQGFFSAAFSNQEIADLKEGNSWLTITAGNWLTQAKKTDMKFPIKMLNKEKENLKPVNISSPKFYYGRILFEDGSPAVLDKSIWQGAEIMIDFPYAGPPEIDSEGFFKVYFTPEQYEKVKERKARKNIYIPDSQDIRRATALYAFPVAQLSKDKSKAGVVKIPRPNPPKKELAEAESKVGKSIPGFDNIKFETFQQEQAQNKPLLICFWDMDQRPSRQYVQMLEQQKDTLQNKNISVLIIHAGTKEEKQVRQWLKENNISIVCGTIEGDPYEILLAWGARGMPWLVLTDEKHIITKAGFKPEDLPLTN
jgi:hypothetical protein